jgi:hypothetical protein
VKIKTTQEETLAINQIITDSNFKKGILIVHWPTQENALGQHSKWVNRMQPVWKKNTNRGVADSIKRQTTHDLVFPFETDFSRLHQIYTKSSTDIEKKPKKRKFSLHRGGKIIFSSNYSIAWPVMFLPTRVSLFLSSFSGARPWMLTT